MKNENEKFCTECGNVINVKAEICPKCGVRQPGINSTPVKDNRWLTCVLLCWFLGIFGVHRFYLGKTGTGIIQLITLGGFGIWWLIDFVMIITGNFEDSEGNVIKNG
jgi:TM2 domain-containing membrane protein YozV